MQLLKRKRKLKMTRTEFIKFLQNTVGHFDAWANEQKELDNLGEWIEQFIFYLECADYDKDI